MKHPKLLMGTVGLFALLAIYACAPGPHGGNGGPGGKRLSPSELFTNADVNGDNMLSQKEFTNALPH